MARYKSRYTGAQIDAGIQAARETIPAQLTQIGSNLGELNATLNGGNIPLSVTWTNGFIYVGGASTNSAFQRTELNLTKGQTITFTGGKDSTIDVYALAKKVDTTYTKIQSYAQNAVQETIVYTASEDITIVISSGKTFTDGVVSQVVEGEINEIKDRLSPLESQTEDVYTRVDDLEDYLTNKTDIQSVEWVDGMIYNGSNVSTNAEYERTQPIKVYSGDIVSFTGGKGSSSLSVVAIAKYNNGTYSRIKAYSSSAVENISWTATEECYIVISTKKTEFSGDITIQRKGEIIKIEEHLQTIDSNVLKLQDEVFGVLGEQNIITGILDPSNSISGSTSTSACISVDAGESFRIVGRSSASVIYAFLTSYPAFGKAVTYAQGSSRTFISQSSEAAGTIPSNAKYLLVSITSAGADWSPTEIYFGGVECYKSLNDKIAELKSAGQDTLEWQKANQNIGYVPISVTEEAGKFIGANTGKSAKKSTTSNTNYAVTSPIQLKKGETLFISCSPVPYQWVAAYSSSLGELGNVAISSEGSAKKIFHLYADEDCYVVLSYDKSYEHTIWKIANLPQDYICEDVYLGINADSTYYNYGSKTINDGNGIWCSKTIDVQGKLFIDFSTTFPSGTTSEVALFAFLDENGDYITFAYSYLNVSEGKYSGRTYIPIRTKNVIISVRVHLAKNTICHVYGKEDKPFAKDSSFNTMREMVESRAKGIISVGSMLFKNIVSNPELKEHTQQGFSSVPYFDANESFKQYKAIGDNHFVADGIFDGNMGEEISFVPSSGYLREIVGKGEDDTFYTTLFPSSHNGAAGDSKRVILERTKDFINFETIVRGYNNTTDEGIYVANIALLKIAIVKECADGSLIMGCRYRDDSKPATDGSGNTRYNEYLGCFRISQDRESINVCEGYDIDGNQSNVIFSHGIANGGSSYVSANMYDWSMQVCGNRVLATEYGSRDSLHDDWGRVWYSEDCGISWKEVFQTRQHISEGVADGSQQPSHTHGIMIDPYSNNIFVIVGENNRNLFYTDKGMNATSTDWVCLAIREQLIVPNLSYMQVVNGYPFKDRIIFGADNGGIGALYAINRLEDGGFSEIEIAHEILPFNFSGTTYCSAAQSRRDVNSPALLCVTRENQASTEAQNELLMQQHLGRVIATWDGISFFEIWHDNTYGSHQANVGGTITTKNYAYCTRGMQAWLLQNGDLVIKYAGRNYFYYGGSDYSSIATGDFSARCYIIRNAERYLVVK